MKRVSITKDFTIPTHTFAWHVFSSLPRDRVEYDPETGTLIMHRAGRLPLIVREPKGGGDVDCFLLDDGIERPIGYFNETDKIGRAWEGGLPPLRPEIVRVTAGMRLASEDWAEFGYTVHLGGSSVEVTGTPLDALEMASLFVQVLGSDQAPDLLAVANLAERNGQAPVARVIRTAVTLWKQALAAYQERA